MILWHIPKKKEIEYKRNITFFEARTRVEFKMGVNSYATEDKPIRKSIQPEDFRAHVAKLIEMEPNDWPKFQEQQKNL